MPSLMNSMQRSECDNLKNRLKQYGDYDEIKRELEIMKVGYGYDGNDDAHSSRLVCRILRYGGRRRRR